MSGLLLSLPETGAEQSNESQEDGAADLAPVAAADPAVVTGAGGVPPDVSGYWEVEMFTSSIFRLPVLGRSRQTTRAIAHWRVVQEGSRLQIEQSLCGLEMDGPHALVKAELLPSLVDGVGVDRFTAELIPDGESWRLEQRALWQTLGARLGPGEDLPTEPSDVRLIDQDDDGHPGITVEVSGFVNGQIYTVRRAWMEAQGVLVDPQRIEGILYWGEEQSPLGASHPRLLRAPPSTPEDNDDQRFIARRSEQRGCGG